MKIKLRVHPTDDSRLTSETSVVVGVEPSCIRIEILPAGDAVDFLPYKRVECPTPDAASAMADKLVKAVRGR